MTKTIYLIPVPISDNIDSLSTETVRTISSLFHFAVEDIKTARRMLRKMGYQKNFDTEVSFFEWNKHTEIQEYTIINHWLKNSIPFGLMSDAGLPCIADPGNEIVALAHKENYTIHPLSGPSSIILALISSGFNGQNFAFNGYLPIDKIDRKTKLLSLELRSKTESQTQLFMETPYRNNNLFEEMIQWLNKSTKLSIASDITSSSSYIHTKTIAQWQVSQAPTLHKRPTIFSISCT